MGATNVPQTLNYYRVALRWPSGGNTDIPGKNYSVAETPGYPFRGNTFTVGPHVVSWIGSKIGSKKLQRPAEPAG
jgi:hypothetical protein